MGDRTNVSMIVSREDAPRVIEAFRYKPDESWDRGDAVELYYIEANYGGSAEQDELEAARVPFISEWGDGDRYSAGAMVYDGENQYTVARTWYDGEVVVPVHKDGPDKQALETALKYLEMEERLLAQWKAEPTPEMAA